MTDEVSLNSNTHSECERERNDGQIEAAYELFNSHHYKQATICLRVRNLVSQSPVFAASQRRSRCDSGPDITGGSELGGRAECGDSERCDH